MSNYPPGRGPRPADPHPRLRLAALTAVILGVVLLAAAAFVLSYSGIHQIALSAGVAPRLARIYPLIFDAMLVIAGAAALALRGAGWWARTYAWFSLLLLLAAVATGDAVHATHVALPVKPSRAAVAITPWVLLLLAFGLWLEMLRHFRKTRAVNALARVEAAAAAGPAAPGDTAASGHVRLAQNADQAANGDAGSGAGRTAVTWAAAAGADEGRALPRPRSGIDTLLGQKEEHAPVAAAAGHEADAVTEEYAPAAGQAQHSGGYLDPVSYGEETGYVHPESYQDYPGHGGSGQDGYAGDYPDQGGHGQDGYAADYPDEYAGHGDYPGAGGYPGQDEDPRQGHHTSYPEPESPAGPGERPARDEPPAAAENDEPPAAAENDEPPAAAENDEPQAAAENPAPAAGQDSAPNRESPQEPAPPGGPRLERLRSTPAPPEEREK